MAAYRTQHLATTPAGWRVRSKRVGSHVLRFAFPPGRPKKGAGKLLEILHPKKNTACNTGRCEAKNPAELVIFGNPFRGNKLSNLYEIIEFTPSDVSRRMYKGMPRAEAKKTLDELRKRTEGSGWRYIMRRERNPTKNKNATGGFGNHKPGCPCAFCKRAKGLQDGTIKPPPLHRRNRKHKAPNTARRSAYIRRKNPGEMDAAVQLREAFTGAKAKEIIDAQQSAAIRLEYTALGPLLGLGLGEPQQSGDRLVKRWQNENHIGFGKRDGVMLAIAPNGKHLYLIGGKQDLSRDLADFDGVDASKDFVDLGECGFVVYFAHKKHDNFEPVDYVHRFGEEGGALPRLMYDQIRRTIYFVGGDYFIDKKDGLSPGIEG